MLIQIDTREYELKNKIESLIKVIPSFKDINVEVKQLPLGDIIIHDGEKDVLIIERKNLNDLSASIKDGRYEEQSYRLNGIDHHNHNIIYLIEGDLTRYAAHTFKERVDILTLYSAIFSLNYYKGFSVMRSLDMNETATMICNMVSKLRRSKDKTAFYPTITVQQESNIEDVSGNVTEKEYCTVVKKVKKENVTIENIGEIMLCQIPGISSSTAIAILGKFKTIANLIQSIQKDPKCLDGVCTVDVKQKSRKISKTVIESIHKFLST